MWPDAAPDTYESGDTVDSSVATALDASTPSAARIYDYLLGGKDNYAVDREAAERVLAVAPDQRRLARANRAFLIRAVRALAEAGIRQFIDLGTGLPTSPSVHEVAREIDPAARVVYVDKDPIVKVHNDALLATDSNVVSLLADIRDSDAILADPHLHELIDFSAPVGLLCVAVLHIVPDAYDPAGIVRAFTDRLAPGSHLALSQFSADSDPAAMAELHAVAANTPVETYFRTREQIRGFFGEFELLPPGLVDVHAWRPTAPAVPTRLRIAGAVGVKPMRG
jgi:SAM-dependent methyltransferase